MAKVLPVDEQEDRRRRMRAARAIGGFKNVGDLADAITADASLGERTLRKFESGESPLRPPAMREIAHACGLPYEFFTADFSRLPELADQPASTEPLAEQVREQGQRLERIEALLLGAQARDPLLDQLVEGGRREQEILKPALGQPGSQETGSAAGTRDEEDATTAKQQPQHARKQASERRRAQ